MEIEPTSLPGVYVLSATLHADARGHFWEYFSPAEFARLGLPTAFPLEGASVSQPNVLRGLHYQIDPPQGKLVWATSGEIFDVAVDLRRSSAHFGQWTAMRLRAGDGRALWIPPGFAHGFLALSDGAHVHYKFSAPYERAASRAVRWDDQTIGIGWPLDPSEVPILSPGDATAPLLQNAECYA